MSTQQNNENLHPITQNEPPAAMESGPFAMRKSGLLARKGLGAGGGRGNMISPTDNMMSPVTAKLKDAKKKHFQKGAPANLASRFANSITPGSPSASENGSVHCGGNEKTQDAINGGMRTPLAKDDGNPF